MLQCRNRVKTAFKLSCSLPLLVGIFDDCLVMLASIQSHVDLRLQIGHIVLSIQEKIIINLYENPTNIVRN